MQGTDSGTPAAWPPPARAWYTVGVLMVGYVAAFVDRQVLSLLVEPIKATLGLRDSQLGLLQGFAFATFYTLLGLPIARWVDHSNRRNLIIAGVTLWTIMTTACGLARNFWELLLARCGVGVGEATLAPAAISMISDSFPPERRALGVGLYISAGSMGGGLAFLIGGSAIAAVAHWDLSGIPVLERLHAWQLVFLLVGLPGLLVALLFLTLNEPLRRERKPEQPGDGTGVFSADLREFLRRHRTLLLRHFSGLGMHSVLSYAVISWIPTFFVRHYGWTPAYFGLVFGFVFLFSGAAGAISGGVIATYMRRAGRRDANLRTTAIGVTLAAPVCLSVCLVGNDWLSMALLGAGVFLTTFPGGASVAAFQEITPNELRGRVTALYYLAINLFGAGLGAFAVGFATDFVFRDDAAIGWSLALVTGIAGPMGTILLWAALPYFQRAIDARDVPA
jgi:MFS family permease